MGFLAGWFLRPGAGVVRSSGRESPSEERLAEAERRVRLLEGEREELQTKLREAETRAAAAPAPHPAAGSAPPAGEGAGSAPPRKFAFDALSDKLGQVDWAASGTAIARLAPLLGELATALAEGKELPPSAADIQTHNAPLARLALTLRQQGVEGTGANGSFTHPAVVVNLVYAALREAGLPLDAGQEKQLADLGYRFLEEDRRRIGSYPEATFAFRRLFEEAELKDRLFHEIDLLLTEPQREALHPAAVRDRLAIDTFCSGILWYPSQRILTHRTAEELREAVAREAGEGLALDAAAKAAMAQAVTDWAAGFPQGFLEEPGDRLARAGMERLDRVRVVAARQLQLVESLPARLALTPEQVRTLAAGQELWLPLRTLP